MNFATVGIGAKGVHAVQDSQSAQVDQEHKAHETDWGPQWHCLIARWGGGCGPALLAGKNRAIEIAGTEAGTTKVVDNLKVRD